MTFLRSLENVANMEHISIREIGILAQVSSEFPILRLAAFDGVFDTLRELDFDFAVWSTYLEAILQFPISHRLKKATKHIFTAV